jgi:hypothetical protein
MLNGSPPRETALRRFGFLSLLRAMCLCCFFGPTPVTRRVRLLRFGLRIDRLDLRRLLRIILYLRNLMHSLSDQEME